MKASLTADGELTATLTETSHGHAAVARARLQSNIADFRKEIQGRLSGFINGAQLETLKPHAGTESSGFEATIRAGNFGQITGGLFIFRPAPVWLGPDSAFAATSRRQPLMLPALQVTDSFHFNLPAGFAVDEMPSAVSLRSEWATFDSVCESKNGVIEGRRSLTIHGGTVPPERYAAARSFFAKISGSARTPVVLVRR
jgi:hypothetical protein